MIQRDLLEKAYKIAAWRDDPWTVEGRERYLKAIENFRRLTKHIWFEDLENKVKILDLCSGKGIGGVALSKVLEENGIIAELTMVDIREDAIKNSIKFSQEEGIKAEAYSMNVLDAYKLGSFDIVLIYGASLVHFNEWSLIKLMASASISLKDNGIIIIDEMDRINTIFKNGFKNFIVENKDPENLSISIHDRYDYLTGSYYRTFIKLKDSESITLPLTFRSISHIASILWLFMNDIDIIPEDPPLYFIIGKEPRRIIKPQILKKPKALLNKSK